jgi:hypothetical protein
MSVVGVSSDSTTSYFILFLRKNVAIFRLLLRVNTHTHPRACRWAPGVGTTSAGVSGGVGGWDRGGGC